jgi:hypothetical protein
MAQPPREIGPGAVSLITSAVSRESGAHFGSTLLALDLLYGALAHRSEPLDPDDDSEETA